MKDSDIKKVIGKEPDLCSFGIDKLKTEELELNDLYDEKDEIKVCINYIQSRKPRTRINKNLTSYAWKHLVEEFYLKENAEGMYISNGALAIDK